MLLRRRMSRLTRTTEKFVAERRAAGVVAGADVEHADDSRPDAAGQAAARRIGTGRPAFEADAAAEEQDRRVAVAVARPRPVAAEIEDALALEEELALLREEQAEAREVDLLLVVFDLREVGVVR